MADTPRKHRRFFAELKRRQVFRVMAVYGVVGFGLLQVVEMAVPALLLPEWTYRLVAFLLLLGFPVAIGMAWAFEATGEGLRRHRRAEPRELQEILEAPPSRRWPAGIFALAGVGLVAWGAWHVGRTSAVGATHEGARGAVTEAEAGAVTSIAVLPFVNMSADPEQEYFSDGISEELLNLLAHVPALQVVARTSSFAFKDDRDAGIREIGIQLGVEHVLEGSVRKSGDRVRITAQLIRAEDGFHLWSDTWDRTLEDIFAIQDEIASDVVRQLELRLLGGTPKVPSVDPEAYNLVLQARHLVQLGTGESVTRAGELYREALALDSTYADAWVGLAGQALQLVRLGLLPLPEGESRMEATARRALEIDPENAGAYAALGNVAAYVQNDPKRAAEHFERALELDPASHSVLGDAALLLRDIGRFEEAEAVLTYLLERDPVNPAAHDRLATVARMAGRCDDAISAHRMALALSPSAPVIRYEIAMCLLLTGEPEAALEEVAREPDEEYRTKLTAMIHHTLGNEAEHEAAFRELRETWGERWPSEVAQVYAYTGQADAAFAWLDRALAQGEDGLDQQHNYPFYDPIRDDPRWRAFLERTGTSREQLDAIDFEVRLPE